MWELDHKESWELRNWCFSSVVLEKTLESPLDCKEIQPVHPKGELDHKESWALTNWCFSTVVLEKTLESPLHCKEIQPVSPEYSLGGLMLKLKLHYFGHLMWRTDSFERPWCWERLKAGGEGVDRGWDGWMALPTQWTWVWVSSGSWWWTGKPGVLQSMGSQRLGHDWVTELNWYRKWNRKCSVCTWEKCICCCWVECSVCLLDITGLLCCLNSLFPFLSSVWLFHMYICVFMYIYIWNYKLKEHNTWASLVVQWLRIHLPMQRTQVRSLI